VGCQSNLHQWGLAFSVYTADHDGKFFYVDLTAWLKPVKALWIQNRDILLCPTARTFLAEIPIDASGGGAAGSIGRGSVGTRLSAWKMSGAYADLLSVASPVLGSYGLNEYVFDPHVPGRVEPLTEEAIQRDHMQWGTVVVQGAANIPFLLDCRSPMALGADFLPPPAYEDVWPDQTLMDLFCINRHQGGVNSLFMDWSVRKVGLKELWTLTWHRGCTTTGPWTTAGGVKPEDWPPWMRRFKDY